jgi:S-adenosylmethionine:tRNA ribosyltransferase-isomerase
MKTIEFDYNLPEELIATYPSKDRTKSRLLIDGNPEEHRIFSEIDKFINKDDLLILNNTSVLPARLFGKKETGGEVEVFLERIIGKTTALVQIRSSRSPKPGTLIIIENNEHRHKLLCKERKEGFLIVDFQEDPKKIFNMLGNTPLPPYIKRKIEIEDRHRYQTVYENKDYQESVAAPTAGLHFDNLLLKNIEKIGAKIRYINLTVGAGTFQPVKVENIKDHKIHSEYISVSNELVTEIINTKKIGGNIIAVGTTSLRAIETVFSKKLDQFDGLTDIFIYPGYKFKAVDKLITNFHLPKSTLLMLVAAFIGFDRMKELYEIAIKKKYKFLSYGDAMFLTKK